MSQKLSEDSDQPGVELPLRFIVPHDLSMMFVSNVIVRHDDQVFTLQFFQARPPVATNQAELAMVTAIEAICVSQVVLTPKHVERVVKALTDSLKQFESAQKSRSES